MTKTSLFYIRRLLVLTICLLFIIFLSIEVYEIEFFISASILKFSSVFICLTIAILSSPLSNQSKDTFLLQMGLVFTLMADYIFLIHDDDYSIAIALFSIVQIIYSLRYRYGNERERLIKFIVLFIIIVFLYNFLNNFSIEFDIIFAMGFYYAFCLIISLKEACGLYKSNPYKNSNKMILFAMLLFFLCDFSLGLNYILDQVQTSSYVLKWIEVLSSITIWIFYLPSQLLLALSGNDLQ